MIFLFFGACVAFGLFSLQQGWWFGIAISAAGALWAYVSADPDWDEDEQ